MGEKRTVVVGGGVVGILSAILRAKRGHSVVILEQEDKFGGLLGSFPNENDAWFDYGTHLPATIGIRELDDILFGDQSFESNYFHKFDYLKSENFFGNQWYKKSPLIDARVLPEDLYNKGVVELLESEGEDSERDLEKFLLGHFGKTFTDYIFRPIIKKLLGVELKGLNYEAIRTFGLVRLIALNSSDSLLLKQLPKYDSRLAYHSYEDGDPHIHYLYPKGKSGIGKWVDHLLDQAKSLNIELVTSESVSKINRNIKGELQSVETCNKGKLDCDELIWTIAPPIAYKCADLPLKPTPVNFRTTTLVHLQYDRPLEKSFPQYLLCWEPSKLSYRITLYPNISDDKERSTMNNLTVEVLSDLETAQNQEKVKKQVLQELVDMGVVSSQANPIYSKIQTIKNTFPVVTNEFVENIKSLAEGLEDEIKGLKVVGRGSGKAFFIKDLFLHAYERLK